MNVPFQLRVRCSIECVKNIIIFEHEGSSHLVFVDIPVGIYHIFPKKDVINACDTVRGKGRILFWGMINFSTATIIHKGINIVYKTEFQGTEVAIKKVPFGLWSRNPDEEAELH